MQKSLSAYNQPFIPSSSPSSTTINQLANMFQLGNSLTTTTTTTTTSKIDSENRVIFADPSSNCGTKNRSVSPIHQNQDFFFSPRKRLFIQSPPLPSITMIPPFQTNSVSQKQSILSSPSSSLPSSIENNRNNAIAPKSPVSSIKLDSFAKSPENRQSVSQPVAYLGQLGSFSASSGSTAEESPASASRSPRPPKLFRSIADPLSTSSPGTNILSLPDQKGWNILKDCLAALNQLVNDSTQKEEAEDHKDDNENKHVSESDGEENADTEENPVGMFKCSCGKRNNATAPKSPVSSIKLDSFARLPENRPSDSQPASYLGQLGSFSAASGSTAEGSPGSASRTPPDPLLTSSPETKKGWDILNDCLAALNQLVNDSTQKEEAEDHKDDNENKHVSESNGEENAETEGNPVDMFKCSCGKRCIQIFVKTLVRTITLMVKCSDTVAYVKRKIEEKEGIPEVHQSLLFSGKELVEGRTLADYNVRNFATLQLELRVCGGSPYCLFCPKKRFETHGDVLRHLMNHKKVDENKEMEAQKKQKDWKKKSARHGKAPGEKKKEGEKKKKNKVKGGKEKKD